MVLPIVNAMQSLQSLLTSLSGGLSSITGAISGIGSAFSGVFSGLGEMASNAFGEITDTIGDVKGDIEEGLGSAFDFLKGKFDGIFDKKKVEEAMAPISQFTTAQEVSAAGYADAITRGKVQQEQLAASAASKQQAADVAAIQRGAVNVTVNAGGITDRTDKKQMALEIGNEIQRELARYNAGLTRAPRL